MNTKGISRRVLFMGIFALFLLSPDARAQTGNKNDAEKRQLLYDWAPGQVLRFTQYIEGKIKETGKPDERILIQQELSWKVLSGGGERYKLRQTALERKGTDQALGGFGILSGDETVAMTVDNYGRVAGVSHYGEGSRFHYMPLVFTSEPVSPGSKWKIGKDATILVPVLGIEVSAPLDMFFTFEDIHHGYKTIGHDCARIRVDARYEYVSSDGGYGVSGHFQGKVFFDMVDRRIVDYRMEDNRKEWSRDEKTERITNLTLTAIMRK